MDVPKFQAMAFNVTNVRGVYSTVVPRFRKVNQFKTFAIGVRWVCFAILIKKANQTLIISCGIRRRNTRRVFLHFCV